MYTSSSLVSVVGIDNVTVIETADAVLVANRSKSQNVKHIVNRLEAQNRAEKNLHLKVACPWGCYDSVDEGKRFRVKCIQVKPGASLSLQMHHHRVSSFNTDRIDHIYQDPHLDHQDLILHYGDLTDTSNLVRIIQECQPDEIYNLGTQSHVAVSFESPEYTADVDAMGRLRMLEAIRILGLEKKTRFYQASTSELYGLVQEIPQKETTPFYPRSPYAVAKLSAYWITVNYREAYGIYACNGILFNHESKRRGETFVTRKVTRGLANIAQGLEKCLYMGNIDALRDWGHAKDYVRMQWLMMQQEKPEDFVIATGVQFTVREFITRSAKQLGITLKFEGKAENEKAIVASIDGDKAPALKVGDVIVKIDPHYYRPTEVETLLGDPAKAKEKLGWVPEITLDQMIVEMVANDLDKAKQHALLLQHGHSVSVGKEN